ncbi:MAG: terminase small subunit [Lactiplantibacillus plantarum]|uniref:terminase small subunit n=1 Tax=Levilactobacillus brevis TaxID=1580 RepID=UPI0011DC4C79|nr:terminase small subunit [Lactiplantibacillus plantarum]MDN6789662.1 terminase small subunit [Lactiplantibacillus plantarum]MDN6825208.1 terminase small subunit [Lactiplantibacillus plantarum]TYA97090.1 terminase small subunit [Lactobacillus sp. SL9-6]
MKLTVKQQKFADNYIKSGNATQSAIDAGYSKSTSRSIGQENLTKPDIKNYIKDKLAKIESHKIMDATEALQLLTSIARGETKETVISSTPFGTTEDEKTADLKTRISAMKEILKRYPSSDKLMSAKIRKLEAEADVAEQKARDARSGGQDVGKQFDKMFERLKEDSDK